MVIKSIELKNFRNYPQLKIDLSQGINIFYGDNAQGKTNILEAIYVCATTKSHRGSKDGEMVKFGEDESHIKMGILKKDIMYRIDMHLKRNKSKGIAVDGIPIKKSSELFGIANIVIFSPEDLQLIKRGPAQRRRFIDLELCQLDKIYVYSLVNYNKVVIQRNQLLKDLPFRQDLADTLSIWDEQLVSYGQKIIEIRTTFIKELNRIVADIHKKISGGREELVVEYEPSVNKEEFGERLLKTRDKDIRQKMTLIGPHRDDISFLINGVDIRKFGSQGQQRTAALSLKMAEIELVKLRVGQNPILLLDDVLSELDGNRQMKLLDSIENVQTLITCTGLDDFVNNRFHIDKIFCVKDGAVSCEN